MHAAVPYAHAEGFQNGLLKKEKTDSHADARKELHECTHQFLTRSLHMKAGACTEGIFSIIFKVPKTAKIKKKSLLTLTDGLKSFTKFFLPKLKKSSLKLG